MEEKVFAVSIVYQRERQGGGQTTVDTSLRCIALVAFDRSHALGMGVDYFNKEMKDYSIALHSVVEIPSVMKTQTESGTVLPDTSELILNFGNFLLERQHSPENPEWVAEQFESYKKSIGWETPSGE